MKVIDVHCSANRPMSAQWCRAKILVGRKDDFPEVALWGFHRAAGHAPMLAQSRGKEKPRREGVSRRGRFRVGGRCAVVEDRAPMVRPYRSERKAPPVRAGQVLPNIAVLATNAGAPERRTASTLCGAFATVSLCQNRTSCRKTSAAASRARDLCAAPWPRVQDIADENFCGPRKNH